MLVLGRVGIFNVESFGRQGASGVCEVRYHPGVMVIPDFSRKMGARTRNWGWEEKCQQKKMHPMDVFSMFFFLTIYIIYIYNII